jgi:N6-L-threonylcarbamoyladenine synthase
MIALAGALRLERWPEQASRDYAFTVKPRWDLASLAR